MRPVRLAYTSCLLIALAACGSSTRPDTVPLTVQFGVSPTSVHAQGKVTFTWHVTNRSSETVRYPLRGDLSGWDARVINNAGYLVWQRSRLPAAGTGAELVLAAGGDTVFTEDRNLVEILGEFRPVGTYRVQGGLLGETDGAKIDADTTVILSVLP